jgi:hypothetical protein
LTHDPTVVEAMGALCAMEFCRDLGVQYVIFEGDFAQVIKAISLDDFLWCRYGQDVEDINNMLRGFQNYDVKHSK